MKKVMLINRAKVMESKEKEEQNSRQKDSGTTGNGEETK